MKSLLIFACLTPILAQDPGTELFEKKIRPVLATKCFGCHSSKLKTPMGGLTLDTKAGMQKGGAQGPEIVPQKPNESRLLTALRYTDHELQMPPSSKLPDNVIADFETWIAAGAPDPRVDVKTASGPAPIRAMTLEQAKQWWAYQPLRSAPAGSTIASLLLDKLKTRGLTFSPEADRRTLIRRAALDLIGIAPTYEETEAFVHDKNPAAYEALVDRLLASPHYGERWARYWMDVARYGEDNPRQGATNPPYTYAWRYRDWIIEAFNRDVPYDRFIKLQLAADLIPGTKRDDWRALGYLGIGPVYHKDQRLAKDVVETLAADDWDERVDVVSRGLLGMSVACARCHDHKFDPISTKDYYGLAGVFASTAPVQRPMFEVDPKVEQRFLWIKQRVFELNYLARLLTAEKGTDLEGNRRRVIAFKAEIEKLKAEADVLCAGQPELRAQIEKSTPTAPFMDVVYDSSQWINGADPALTMIDYEPGKSRDLNVFLHGNPATQGPSAPRHFPTVLAKSSTVFQEGSGREELAERIFTDGSPLAARVIVNRVWAMHFGKPIVATPSDFGTQGDKPSNPELLDDLAARFVAHGWSFKWLQREIMLSPAYRQSSRPSPEGLKADQENTLLWRMNPRRLDIESYRDSVLHASGKLDETLYGPSLDLDSAANNRRTIYVKVSRETMNTVLRLYDVPDASIHSPGRDLTITPLQQLYALNSPFFATQSDLIATSASSATGNPEKVRNLYRRIFARDPSPKEMDLGLSYLQSGTLAHYAQALLASNEFIFWP